MAFRAIDVAFADETARPYKKSRKQGPDGTAVIELAFVSPEVGRRCADLLARLEQETGWPIRIAEKVDQIRVLSVARRLIPETWPLKKGPGLDLASRRVLLSLAGQVPEEELAAVSARLEEETGFVLARKK